MFSWYGFRIFLKSFVTILVAPIITGMIIRYYYYYYYHHHHHHFVVVVVVIVVQATVNTRSKRDMNLGIACDLSVYTPSTL